MEMFYLIIHIGYSSIIIPEKYSKEQCEKIASNSSWIGYCIPVPKEEYYNCMISVPDKLNPGMGIAVKSHCDGVNK